MRKWTKADKALVKSLLLWLANEIGGQAEIARRLKLEDRRHVNHWISRGRVPPGNVKALLDLAEKAGQTWDAAKLCPEARALAA